MWIDMFGLEHVLVAGVCGYRIEPYGFVKDAKVVDQPIGHSFLRTLLLCTARNN